MIRSWAKPPSGASLSRSAEQSRITALRRVNARLLRAAAECSRWFGPVLVDAAHNSVKAQENKAIGADVGGADVVGEFWLPGPPPPLNTLRWGERIWTPVN
ncbi:MAG TPA: hypothetical protein PLC99_03270 [Verrucomicrobiota bacterium]|nr:hypothetical protein [Verrucomicrobiota bacterium]